MMKIFRCFLSLFVLLAAVSAVRGEELNVLMIGNSFTKSLMGMLEPVVDSVPGCSIHLENIYIGGCTLERHWTNIVTEEKDRDARFFPEFTYREKLESYPWDYVSIQQSSPLSWKPESYWPWGENMLGYIRKYAPTAEPVIQQTWSYRPDDHRLAEWGMTQTEMDEKVFAGYRQASEKLGLRVIPVGLAVKMARAEEPGGYHYFDPADYTYPDLPSLDSCFIGDVKWSEDKTKLEGDASHLNLRGRYLQAAVWFAFLFKRPATEIKYVPKGITEEDARFIREIADKALEEYYQ